MEKIVTGQALHPYGENWWKQCECNFVVIFNFSIGLERIQDGSTVSLVDRMHGASHKGTDQYRVSLLPPTGKHLHMF